MTKRFGFDYKGIKVKAHYDELIKQVVVSDIMFSVGGQKFMLADLEWNNKFEALVMELEKAADKHFKVLVKNGRI